MQGVGVVFIDVIIKFITFQVTKFVITTIHDKLIWIKVRLTVSSSIIIAISTILQHVIHSQAGPLAAI